MLPVSIPPPTVAASPRDLSTTPDHDDGVSGDVVLVSDFPSEALHNKRNLLIYLPPGYENAGNTQNYPVLYVHDGQNVFDPQTSAFGHEWHLDEWAEGLIRGNKMQSIIIVAVYNTPDRTSELTPVPDPNDGGGNGAAYEDFLMHEVKPWVDAHYRTRPAAADTGILGSSLGGLISLDAAFRHPDVFGRVGAESPSVWWDNENFTTTLEASPLMPSPQTVCISMGTREGDDPAGNIKFAEHLHQVLQKRGYQDGQNLFYEEVPGGEHNEDAWAGISGTILMQMFPPTRD